MTIKKLGPLDWRISIVDNAGRPTPEFQRRWAIQITNNDLIPAGANPTAVASDAAVNGVATTFMRSDAAPRIQLATNSKFGLVKPDNVTVTISAGVISAVGGGLAVNGMLPLVTGDLPGPSAIADGRGQYIGIPL